MYEIQRMTLDDLDFAVQITQQEGWGYARNDMQRLLRWSPDGCFIVWMEGSRVGLTTTLFYGTFGWVGNVVISKDCRRRGVGTSLMRHVITHITDRGARGTRLFAYENTIPFYEGMGFRHEGQAQVYRRAAAKWGPVLAPPGHIVMPLRREDQPLALALDSEAFGGDRSHVLKTIWQENPGLSYGLWEEERRRLRGIIVGKKVLGNIEVGPWLCDLPGTAGSLALLDTLLSTTDTLTFMAVPDLQTELIKAIGTRGFAAIDRVFGMYVGQPPPMRLDSILAYGALEKG